MNTKNNTDIRSVADLQARLKAGLAPDYLCFWGHRPEQSGAVGKGCLSQWFGAEFTLEGDRFRSAEHFMMAEKARLFGDEEIRAQMLVASTPDQVKKLGRRVRNFNEALWTAERFDIVRRGNIAKFGQNPGMRNFLLGTGQRILVEASPVDAIWGIGLAATDPRATQPAQWAGLNLLGFALMAAREALRREPAGENATVRGAP